MRHTRMPAEGSVRAEPRRTAVERRTVYTVEFCAKQRKEKGNVNVVEKRKEKIKLNPEAEKSAEKCY
jgi:hypothetical protein